MNIVLLESLGISPERLSEYARPLVEAGHTFNAYPRDLDIQVQIERAREADVIIIANMPLRGEVIRACKHLKFIDVAFTGVDHVDLDAARECGVKVSNAAGYSTQAVAELALCMMLSLLRNVPQVAGVAVRERPKTVWSAVNCAARLWELSVQEPSEHVRLNCARLLAAGCWETNAI